MLLLIVTTLCFSHMPVQRRGSMGTFLVGMEQGKCVPDHVCLILAWSTDELGLQGWPRESLHRCQPERGVEVRQPIGGTPPFRGWASQGKRATNRAAAVRARGRQLGRSQQATTEAWMATNRESCARLLDGDSKQRRQRAVEGLGAWWQKATATGAPADGS